MKASVADRLGRRSVRSDGGCLLWTGFIDKNTGYGVISVDGRLTKVHRAAWQAIHGSIPDGMKVCHTCDVRHCVEPTHLWLGTQADNMRDMYQKGRHPIIGGWNRGRPHSAETKAKIGAKASQRTGWHHSPETKAKMAAARAAWWRQRLKG